MHPISSTHSSSSFQQNNCLSDEPVLHWAICTITCLGILAYLVGGALLIDSSVVDLNVEVAQGGMGLVLLVVGGTCALAGGFFLCLKRNHMVKKRNLLHQFRV